MASLVVPRDAAADKFPPQIKYIVGNEACERFSFYGMIGILTLYIKNQLAQGAAEATEISHLFKFGVYFLPLLGAWISDRLLGRYRTILYISFFYCAGHALLALGDVFYKLPPLPVLPVGDLTAAARAEVAETARVAYATANADMIHGRLWFLYGGLMLLAFGGGGIKPCVSAFVGDQFRANQNHLLQKAYGLFYWSINFGSFFSFLIIPLVARKYGYGWAFGIPGIFMGLATLIFWLGRHTYQHVPPAGPSEENFWGMLFYGLGRGLPGTGFWDRCRGRFSAEAVAGAKAATRVAWVFALIPFFWALWDQNSTTWVIQGEHMVPYRFPQAVMDHPILGSVLGFIVGDTIGAEQMQSLNALVVMILVPLFTFLFFPLSERLGARVTTLRRIGVGLFLTAFSFVMIAWLEQRISAGEKLSVLRQSWAYVVLTAGEVLVSTTGLEFAFREAPAKMRSTLMSFWLLTTALGNLLVAWLIKFNVKGKSPQGVDLLYFSGQQQFFLFAGLLTVVGVLFILVALGYRYRDPSQEAGLKSTAVD